jgi:4-amino-4-deoxy-L-arabinose transferase-like glycosyltransferase
MEKTSMNIQPWNWSSGRRAVIVGVLTVVLLLATAGNIGLTWDEPAYIAASESYTGWINRLVFGPHGVLNQTVVDSAWEVNHEHPPLDKEISGVVWALARNILDDLLARRLGNILLVGLTVAFLYHMVSDELGEMAAVGAVAAWLTMPRFFFHAHLAALDVPAACMIVLVTYVFWRTKESARFRYTLLLGAVWGLALSTKINAAFILPTLFLWALIFRRKFYIFVRLILAAVIGLPFFIGLWPWLYYDTVNRITEYIEFQTVSHWEIAQYYLHKVLMPPPWHFPFVMAWAVVPLGTTVLYCTGILRGFFRRRARAFCFLLLFNALVPIVLLAAGKSMVYDDERLFMPAFPFLAALAGIGFSWLVQELKTALQRIRQPILTTILSAAAAALFLIPPVYSIVAFYPHLLSYYSESVGGLSGAEKTGLETTYWCESYREAIDFINANAQPGDSVWVEPWSSDVLVYYQQHGILRGDVSIAVGSSDELGSVFGTGITPAKIVRSRAQATFVIVQYRQTFFFDKDGNPGELMTWLSVLQPAYRVERQGIPIMEVYWNP